MLVGALAGLVHPRPADSTRRSTASRFSRSWCRRSCSARRSRCRKGKDVGGSFQHVPLCHSASQTGCVITFASFRSTIPPPANTLFGRVPDAEHGGRVHESGGARAAAAASCTPISIRAGRTITSTRARQAVGDARAADRDAVGERARAADREVRVERERERLSRGHRQRQSRRSARRRHRRRHRRGARTCWRTGACTSSTSTSAMGNLLDIVSQQTKVYQRRGKS